MIKRKIEKINTIELSITIHNIKFYQWNWSEKYMKKYIVLKKKTSIRLFTLHKIIKISKNAPQ